MTRQTNCTPAGKCVRMLLSLCLLAFLPVRAWAQGIPFIRNFSATEYVLRNGIAEGYKAVSYPSYAKKPFLMNGLLIV